MGAYAIQISKPMPLPNGFSKNIQLFSTRSGRGFQTFHSELSVVWAKRSLVANNIESKSYYSPLILHSVRVLQNIVWIHKNMRFVETVLLSTLEKLHIKKYTCNLYSESNVSWFYSTYADASMYQVSSCRGFTLLLQLLKYKLASREIIHLLLARTCPNYYFYSEDFWLGMRLADSSLLFSLLMLALERCFPSRSTLSINSPFWKSSHIWRYIIRSLDQDIPLFRKSSQKDRPISV